MNVTIPGALADHLTAQRVTDEETVAVLDAARRGRGRTLVIEPTGTRALHVISAYAEAILENRTLHTAAEVRAARLWIQRAGHAPAAPVATNAFEQGAAGLLDAPRPGRYLLRVCEDPRPVCERGACRTTSTRAAGTLDEVRAAAAMFRHAWPVDEHGNPVADDEQADTADALGREDLADTVACPTCHVPAGARCTTRAGKPAREPHGRRFEAVEDAAGITRHRAAAQREAEARGGWLVALDRRTEDALLMAYAARIKAAAEQRLAAAEAEVAEQFDRTARAADAEQVEAGVGTVAEAEALYAAQMVTEAEATEGTWRGQWIGERPVGDGLFDLARPIEQGALFDGRAADPTGEPPF